MIRISLEAETVEELHQQMVTLLAGATIATSAAPAVEPPKRGRGKKAEEPAEQPKGDEPPADSKPAEPQGELTKEMFSPLVLALGQKAGPTAVTELFGEFGGATKFSQIPVEQYPALKVRLDELLTEDPA